MLDVLQGWLMNNMLEEEQWFKQCFFIVFFQRSVVNYYCSDKQDFQRSFERAPNVKIVNFIKSQNIFDPNRIDLVTINYVICFSIF